MGNQLAREQEQLKNLNCKIHTLLNKFRFWLSHFDISSIYAPILTLLCLWIVSEKELQKLYKNFSKIDKDKSGTLEPEEFFDIPGKSFNSSLTYTRDRAGKQPSGQESDCSAW